MTIELKKEELSFMLVVLSKLTFKVGAGNDFIMAETLNKRIIAALKQEALEAKELKKKNDTTN